MSNLSDFATLSDARAHTEVIGKLIPRTTMNSLLARYDLFLGFQAEADTDSRFAAFMHPTSMEYNFIQSSATGQAQIDMFDQIISEGKFPALAGLRDTVIGLANVETFPHANATEYEFALAKGQQIQTKPVEWEDGFAFITTTGNCEKHNPQILREVRGQLVPVSNFRGVESAGDYRAACPFYPDLVVHDAYGLVQ